MVRLPPSVCVAGFVMVSESGARVPSHRALERRLNVHAGKNCELPAQRDYLSAGVPTVFQDGVQAGATPHNPLSMEKAEALSGRLPFSRKSGARYTEWTNDSERDPRGAHF
jgi:hypothetical protein